MSSVLQDWVQNLTYMQQGVLVSSIRGPDGLSKDHVAKLLIRWLRRCTLHMAFESSDAGHPVVFTDPGSLGGGSFTGPSINGYGDQWERPMFKILKDYMAHLDESPHHFQLHFMHASEILGYKHPNEKIRKWWYECYIRLANDMHLNPESEVQMNFRLGDEEEQWRACEEVIAKAPDSPESKTFGG